MNSAVKKNGIFGAATKLLLGGFFLVAVLLPLIRMLLKLGDADFAKIFADGKVVTALGHSVLVSSVSTVLAIVLALLSAYAIERSSVWCKAIFRVLILLPMLIPSISHGMGLIILLGDNGRLTNLFGWDKGIYGFWGIVVGSIMYAFPVAYLMIADILKYEDSTAYEAAEVLGIPKLRRLTAITLPYLRKPMVSVLFATFTLIVTDYGVPLMIGGMYKTLPVLMYEEVIGRQDFAKGSVFGVILLLPAVIAFFVDLFCKNDKKSSATTRPFAFPRRPLRDTVSFLFLLAVSVFAVYPIVSFIALTFSRRYPSDLTFTLSHIQSTLSKGAGEYLVNSLLIGLFVAVIGTAIAFLCAYFTARVPGRGTGFLHLMSIISLAIPGIVLGLSYVLFFGGSLLDGTLAILVMANAVHFFSSPYLMIYNSMGKLNPNLEAVGATLGLGRLRLIRDVILPQTLGTIAEMFSYFFVNSMMTISAVAFLAKLNTKPISLLIPQFEAQMLLEASAFVSLLILAANLLVKGAVWLIKRMLSHRTVFSHADKKTV